MVFSVRTLFLFVRGVDQTGRALSRPRSQMTDLMKAQDDLARSGYRLMFAGAAFLTFGFMAARGIMAVMENTSKGSLVVEDFMRTWKEFLGVFGEAITEKATPTIDNIIRALDDLAGNQTWQDMAAGVAWKVILTIGGVSLAAIAGGATRFILGKLILPILTALGASEATALAITSGVATLTVPLLIAFAVSLAWLWTPEEVKKGFIKMLQGMWKGLENFLTGTGGADRLYRQDILDQGAFYTPDWQTPYRPGGPSEYNIHIYGNTFEGVEDFDEYLQKIGESNIDKWNDQDYEVP